MRPCGLLWPLLTTVAIVPPAYGLYMARSLSIRYFLHNFPAESAELLLNSIGGDDDESLFNLLRLIQFNGLDFGAMLNGISPQTTKRLISVGQVDFIKRLVPFQALRSSLPLRESIIDNLPLTGETFAEHGWEPEALTAYQGQRVLKYLSSPGYMKIRTFGWCRALSISPMSVESWFHGDLWHLYPVVCLIEFFHKQPSIARTYRERLELLPRAKGLYFLGMVRLAIAISSLQTENDETYAAFQDLIEDIEFLRFFRPRNPTTAQLDEAFTSLESALQGAISEENLHIGAVVSFELAQYMRSSCGFKGQAEVSQFIRRLMNRHLPSELPPALLGEFLASMSHEYYKRIRPETWPFQFSDSLGSALPVQFLAPSDARREWSRFIVGLTPLKYFEESSFTDILTGLAPLLDEMAIESEVIPMYKHFLYKDSASGEKRIQLAEAASLFVGEAFKLGLVRSVGKGIQTVKFNCLTSRITYIRPLLYSLLVMVAADSLPRLPFSKALYDDVNDPTKIPLMEPAEMVCYNRDFKLKYVENFYKVAQVLFAQLYYEYF